MPRPYATAVIGSRMDRRRIGSAAASERRVRAARRSGTGAPRATRRPSRSAGCGSRGRRAPPPRARPRRGPRPRQRWRARRSRGLLEAVATLDEGRLHPGLDEEAGEPDDDRGRRERTEDGRSGQPCHRDVEPEGDRLARELEHGRESGAPDDGPRQILGNLGVNLHVLARSSPRRQCSKVWKFRRPPGTGAPS